MGFTFAFPFPLGGDAAPPVIPPATVAGSVLPRSLGQEPHGIRFANAEFDGLVIAQNGVQTGKFSSVCVGTFAPSNSGKLSGVIGRRFATRFSTTPVSVLATETRNTNPFGIPILG